MIKANYHTHTARCGHASGTDQQYIEAAIARGFDIFGFSDHMPWPYESGFVNPHVRMAIGQMDEYIATMRELKKKYADKIKLFVGFECEYFPQYMNWLRDVKEEKKLDYLIFGCHYEDSDETGRYFGGAKTAEDLTRYVNSAVKGIETGLFAYMAHPDLFMRRYPVFDENCRAAARDICQCCKQNNLPMEINLHDRYRLGGLNGNGYPNADFFEMVYETGNQVIIGLDAHEPQEVENSREYDIAAKEAARFGDRWLRTLNLPK